MSDMPVPTATVLSKLDELIKSIAETADPDATRRFMRTRFSTNPIMMADMYKASHAAQLPNDTTFITSFFEAREGSELPHVVNFGLQMLIGEIAAIRICKEDVDEAFFAKTFGADNIFNETGWREIVDGGGYLPVAIHALPEGMVVPPGTPLFTVENTNPKVPWIANWLETYRMNAWYPITVASVAFRQRQTLERYLALQQVVPESSIASAAKLAFVYFGMRSVSSMTSAARAGAAVLTSFATSNSTLGGYELGKAYGEADAKP
jgi:nicotinamide phosphoribosyltransferase